MAASSSAWASFVPTPAELTYAGQLFTTCDPQGIGIITGDAAVPVFAGSSLPPDTLGEIWALADHDNNGFLTKKGVAVAVRLIAWAQKGEPMSDALLSKPGPLPSIKGIATPPSSQVGTRSASPASRAVPTPSLPPLTGADRNKYIRIFVSSGVSGGLLPGDKARDVFLKSRLPVEKLGQIWTLADTHNRGALDAADFAIGMHLIATCMGNAAFIPPSTLPPGLYEQASGGKPLALQPQHTGGSSSLGSPTRTSFALPGSAGPIKPQYTGQGALNSSPLRPQTTGSGAHPSPLQSQFTGSGRLSSSSPASSALFSSTAPSSVFTASTAPSSIAPQLPWDISPEEKAKADIFFDGLDTQRRGYIEGDTAVSFMVKSQLSEDYLAKIWDLSDLNGDGRLTKDGFAVALHLINNRIAGKEVPDTLSPSLIPPSMRKPTAQSAASPFASPPQAPQSQIQRDLLGDLEDDLSSSHIPAVTTPTPAKPTALSPHHTGSISSPSIKSPQAQPFGAPRAIPKSDLLSDDEDEPESAVRSQQQAAASSLAIANTKNQLESTQRAVSTAKTDRAQIEAAVAESAAQLSQLESQLASAKAQHQTETKLLTDLQNRQQEQMANIRTTREELIRAESDLSALRAEKAEIEGAVLNDKEVIRGLQKQLKEANDAIAAAKADLEKLKKDARQQKGLVVVAKKQLANAEENAEKARKEAEAEREEIARANEELAKTNTAIEELAFRAPEAVAPVTVHDPVALPASIPLPTTPDLQSPAISTPKSNNPFGRLTRQSSVSSATHSAFSPFALPAVAIATGAAVLEGHEAQAETPKESDPFNTAFGIEEPASATNDETTAFHTPVNAETSFADAFGSEEPKPEEAAFALPPGLGAEANNLPYDEPVAAPEEPANHSFETPASPPVAEPTTIEPSPKADLEPIKDVEVDDEDSSDEEEVEEPAPARRPPPAVPVTASVSSLPPQAAAVTPNAFEEPSASAFPPIEDFSVAAPAAPIATAPNGTSQTTESVKPLAPSASFDDAFGIAIPTTSSPPPAIAEPVASQTVESPKPSSVASPFAALEPPPTKATSPAHSPLSFAKQQQPQTSGSLFGDDAFPAPTARFLSAQAQPRPASTAELDDAFGVASPPAGAGAGASNGALQPFTFESSFDDTFTFDPAPFGGAGAANNAAPVPTISAPPAPITNGHSASSPFQIPPPTSPPAIVSSAWPSQPAAPAAVAAVTGMYAPPPGPPPEEQPASNRLGFDDTFGLSATSPSAPQFQPSQPVTPSTAALAPSPRTANRPRAPTSPASPVSDDDDRPLSQLIDRGRRSNSPPPTLRSRLSISPPPTGKAAKNAGKEEASGSKSSKLGLHFPFGKKNKNKDKDKDNKASSSARKNSVSVEPTVSNIDERGAYVSNASTPTRSSRRTGSGPVTQDPIGTVGPDDDIAAVKTLVGMGFTRAQAIDALEQNSYDVPTALNKLLEVPR